MARPKGTGWSPYFVPYVLFLGLVEIGRRTPEEWDGAMLVLKVAAPLAAFAFYLLRGSYPELRGWRPGAGGFLLDVLVGLGSAVLWVAPYLLFEGMRPTDVEGFDARVLGADHEPAALAVRMVGYALATPFIEELFVRSWLMRFVDVYDRGRDFRDAPIARFAWRSFLVVCVYFTLSHQQWEWPVAIAWIVATNLWFYHRRHLASIVLVHAVANASILAFAITCNDHFLDAAGNPLSLWFFV